MTKKVLVTGGLGFVGSNLVDELVKRGDCDVTVIDNLSSESSSWEYNVPGVAYCIGDVRDLDENTFLGTNFDVIYHLAANARIQPSFQKPLEYFEIDALGTNKVLELARKCNAKVVYAGSSSAFGGPMLNPYAFAKYTGEQLCEMYSKVFGVSTVIARFFNVYGKRQPVTGQWATVVGVFERQYRENKPLTVTGDGTQRRDFTNISDIVDGFIALSEGRHSGEMYQLGTGKNYSITELAQLFSEKIEYIPKRPGEADVTLADWKPVYEATGWKAKVAIADYVKKYKDSLNE